jgi:muramidase (phage lysozyme)
MNRGALVAAAGLLAFGAWWAHRAAALSAVGAAEWVDEVGAAVSSAAAEWSDFGGVFVGLSLSKMREVRAEMLQIPNVQAMLRVIRSGEGTSDANGYRRIVGGSLFSSYADHPRLVKSGTFSNGVTWRSTAAGAYQFLESTWDETRRIMNLPDFSPASQDMGALGRIAARGALADVIAGRLDSAMAKCAREWASLPGSPYGQPTISAERARAVFASAGGVALA